MQTTIKGIIDTRGTAAAREAVQSSLVDVHTANELYSFIETFEAKQELNGECHGDVDDIISGEENGD